MLRFRCTTVSFVKFCPTGRHHCLIMSCICYIYTWTSKKPYYLNMKRWIDLLWKNKIKRLQWETSFSIYDMTFPNEQRITVPYNFSFSSSSYIILSPSWSFFPFLTFVPTRNQRKKNENLKIIKKCCTFKLDLFWHFVLYFFFEWWKVKLWL